MPEDNRETHEEMKEQAKDGELKKGYNESNPTQPEGAFPPDSKDETHEKAPGKAEDNKSVD